MSATITNQTDTETTLTISLTTEDLAPFVTLAFDHLRDRVKAPGFRPGKAPNAIVERELGADAVHSEVVDHAMQDSYANAIQANNLPVIAPPNVQITKFVPYTELEFTATVEVLPKFELPNYKKLKSRREKIKVEAADVDKVIDDLRTRQAQRSEVQTPAKSGDEVTFDFEGKRDGKLVEGASSKDYTLVLGSNTFIPGFEDELIGLKSGAEKTFMITFPENYQEKSLAGQPVEFSIKLTKVMAVDLPKLDDAFAATVSDRKTLAELKADVKAALLNERGEQAEKQFEQTVLDEILTATKLHLPKRLVDQQLERMKTEMENNLAASGLDFEKYAQMTNKTEAQVLDEIRPEAEKRVGYAMVLTEIAKAEQLTVSPEELDAEITRLRAQYSDKTVQEELSTPEVREDIYNHLLSSHTIAKILSYLPADA